MMIIIIKLKYNNLLLKNTKEYLKSIIQIFFTTKIILGTY